MTKTHNLSSTLGKKIQRIRKKAKITQEELADKVKISRVYMGYIEQGRNTPSLELVNKIARILKTNLKEFF